MGWRGATKRIARLFFRQARLRHITGVNGGNGEELAEGDKNTRMEEGSNNAAREQVFGGAQRSERPTIPDPEHIGTSALRCRTMWVASLARKGWWLPKKVETKTSIGLKHR